VVLGALLVLPASLASGQDRILEKWSVLLAEIVTEDGSVDYVALTSRLASRFDALLEDLAVADLHAHQSEESRLAFWLNAYNIRFVDRVLEAGVPENLEQYGFEFFFGTPVRVAGVELTLDEIEHVILRQQAGRSEIESLALGHLDPRIHVGLNCGAASCPTLRSVAFTEGNVDAELDRAMVEFVNGEAHFARTANRWRVTSLLDWFGPDWDSTGQPAGDYLLQFVGDDRTHAEALRELLRGRSSQEIIQHPDVHTHYDWRLRAVH